MSKIECMTNNHPECMEGEIFLGNFTKKHSRHIMWKTKRRGEKAICRDGSPVPFAKFHDMYPYFVSIQELKENGVELS